MQKDKKNKQKYYSIKNLLSKNAQYNILLGERSNGKSYSVKYMSLWESYHELEYLGFLEKNKITKKRYQFAYIRRWQDEIKTRDVELYFADMPIEEITDGTYNGVECFRRDIYFKFTDETGVTTRGKKIGSVFALTGVTHYKSLAFPLIGNIVFEEFITNQGYIGHEVDNLIDLVSTIARRDCVRVFLIGNTINRLCPYFTEWELSHVKEQEQGTIDIYTHATNQFDTDGKSIEIIIAVEYCANSGSNSQMFFGKKSAMITSGTWSTSEFPHLPRPINTYHIKYSIYYKYNQFAFKIDLICDNKERFLYVSDAPLTKPQHIKRVVTDTFTTSRYATYYLTEKTRYDTIIMELLAQHKVFFSSNLTGTEFWQIKKERGKF